MQELILIMEPKARRRSQENLTNKGSFLRQSRCKEEESVCTELINQLAFSRWPWEARCGQTSAPEHPIYKTSTSGMDACVHAFIEQKFNFVLGPELDPGDKIWKGTLFVLKVKIACQAKEREKC